jgi:CubicO group peptidase (beta-lactamase class C family)
MTYKPLENGIQKNKIVPSEIDTKYRKQVIQGYVNDFGAAILGNVSGHAGLFSTANDLAIIFQMLLQKGFYADRQYFLPSTIKTFTTPPFHTSHRGLGFDTGNKSSACSMSSNQSFGHTGFTGCIVWADPQYNFIYIFLSNRTFPDAENKEINNYKIRQQVQSLLYHSFIQVAK